MAFHRPTNYPNHMQRPTTMSLNSQSTYVMAKTEAINIKFGRGGNELYKDHDKIPPPAYYINTPPDNGMYTTHLSSDSDDDDDIAPKYTYAPPLPPPPPGYPVPHHDNNSYAPPPPPPGYPVPSHNTGYAPLKSGPHPQIYGREMKKTYGYGYAPLPGLHVPNNGNENERKHDNGGYVPLRLKVIPQIRTRIGANKASPPKRGTQGYQEVIDSAEARRRYGGPFAEEKHNRMIDCKEAAKKYNGIFVPK